MSDKRTISPKTRRICYERDGERCQYPGCTLSRKKGDKVNLHHILPEQFGGTEEPDNLITLCDIHHKAKHIEFSAFYPDSEGILKKMNLITRRAISRIRSTFGADDGNDLVPYLQYLTGKNKFRPGQLETIRAAISGQNVLFVSPTGSGKSVCYQLPGLIAPDPSLVVSPLKALMKNQVESIWSKMIPTTYINSDLGFEERKKRYGFISKQLYKFVFIAPERFYSKDPNTSKLIRKYSHFVVDEVHLIEKWGMAFKPAYRKLGEVRDKLNNPPLIALTATASKATQKSILESLGVEETKVIVTGFYRNNIIIKIHRVGEVDNEGKIQIGKIDYIVNLINDNPNNKIIIFAPTIKIANEICWSLNKSSIDQDLVVEIFHAKLEKTKKMEIQNRFSNTATPAIDVLVSTSAFGMGIDIPDIRHIVHFAPPLGLTEYTQQIGRAGRDGMLAYAHLLYQQSDEGLMKYMAFLPLKSREDFKKDHGYNDSEVKVVENKLVKQIEDMINFTKKADGKEWDYIVDHFGEQLPSFWQKYGQKIIDTCIVLTLVALVTLLVLILKSL